MNKSKKFRLCIVCTVDFIGGAELFVVDFVNEVLNRKNNETEIFIITSKHKAFQKLLSKKAKIIEMDFPRLKKFSLFAIFDFLKTAKNLSRKIQKITPNVVISNSIRAHILLAKTARNLKIPITFFIHDFTFPKVFFSWAQKKAAKIFTCSQAVKKDLIQKDGDAKKIKVIHNGVNIDLFKNLKKSSDKIFKVGIIGRIDKWKGQDVFIAAAEYLSLRDQDLQFCIFGESSKHDKKTVEFEILLRQKVAEKKLKNITFYGFAPIDKALREIDLLVHASSKPEPFGRVVIEAMAAGIPVIASNIGGTKEIIQNNANGILIKPDNPKLLAEKIILLKKDKILRDKLIKNGLKTIEEEFSLNKITDLLLDELKNIALKIKKVD